MAACSSSSDSAQHDTANPNEPAVAPSDIAAASSYPNDTLTTFGATVKKFIANHDPDPDQNLSPHCCFAPVVQNAANGGTASTYNLSGNLGPLVISLTRTFADGTDEQAALSAVESEDLPTDAQLINTVDEGGCKAFVFSSETLGAAAPAGDLGATMTVTMYPPPDPSGDDAPYDATSVDTAYEMSGDTSTDSC